MRLLRLGEVPRSRDTLNSNPPNSTTNPHVPHSTPRAKNRTNGMRERRGSARSVLLGRKRRLRPTMPTVRNNPDSIAVGRDGATAGNSPANISPREASAGKNGSGLAAATGSPGASPTSGPAVRRPAAACHAAATPNDSSAGSRDSGNNPLMRAAGAHSPIPSRHTKSVGASPPLAARRRNSPGDNGPSCSSSRAYHH